MLRLSARFYDKTDLRPIQVSRIYMEITSMRDGHTIWPLEVVRKDAIGFDIGIGTEEMKEGDTYLVRVSNNWNLSPSASTTFILEESSFPVLPLVIPLVLSPIFMRKYMNKGIRNVDDLVAYLKSQGWSDEQIHNELKEILGDVEGLPEDQLRMPIDTDRDIEKKIFVTQMDHRVCPRCQERAANSSPNLPPGHYYPEDPAIPTIPVHLRCRCTFDLIYADPTREASFQSAAVIASLHQKLDVAIPAISFIKNHSW